MELSQAIALLKPGNPGHDRVHPDRVHASRWADLGCGAGLFTRALAHLLPEGSLVYAVDSNAGALDSVAGPAGIAIEKIRLDFIRDEWPFTSLDGILMANSLHYVPDQAAFFQKLRQHLSKTGRLLIVEYDTDAANPWIPYPMPYSALRALGIRAGFLSVEKLGERPSIYHRAAMYSALLTRTAPGDTAI